MNEYVNLPSVNGLKKQARLLRAWHRRQNLPISHSRSLEYLAGHYGLKDWNTLCAKASNQTCRCPVEISSTISGLYLGQPFSGEVIDIKILSPDEYQVTINLDHPVDVVTFDSFSAFRRRLVCTIDEIGLTTEKTSDGVPHCQIILPPETLTSLTVVRNQASSLTQQHI